MFVYRATYGQAWTHRWYTKVDGKYLFVAPTYTDAVGWARILKRTVIKRLHVRCIYIIDEVEAGGARARYRFPTGVYDWEMFTTDAPGQVLVRKEDILSARTVGRVDPREHRKRSNDAVIRERRAENKRFRKLREYRRAKLNPPVVD